MADIELTTEPDHWSNLLWALGTPHIVSGNGLPWLPPERQAPLVDFFSAKHVRQELTVELEELLGSSGGHRLGSYFEGLWAFAFTHHPDYELLTHNLPLRDASRTLGALDFVVQHLSSDTTEHWEIAVKFYLQVDGEHWVGPGLRDRLDIKLARMRDHQLPIAHSPRGQQLLAQQGIRIARQWALMPGRLFRPLAPELAPLPVDINARCAGYWWATAEQFTQEFSARQLLWTPLAKRTWLADRGYSVSTEFSCEKLAERLLAGEQHSPVCVAGLAKGVEVSRGFIVPKNWHAAALTQLR